jgi:hypothetical protein
MDDAPLKPSPEPIHLAVRQVGGQRAIMFGDTKVFTISYIFFSDRQQSNFIVNIFRLKYFRRTISHPPYQPVT